MAHPLVAWLRDRLPQALVGAVEFYLQPGRMDTWGGPFNGQCFRQLIYLDLMRVCRFAAIAETGTFRGSTTLFLALNSGGTTVHTAEINGRFYHLARRRLQRLKNLKMYNLDSREFLSSLKLPPETRTFFYLDAHWRDDLPLADETEFIIRHFKSFSIMIDDFEVAGDSGYAFDDYGPGKRLSLRDFPFHRDKRIHCYRPARPANQESGSRRGSIVLVSPDLKEIVDSLDCLRPVDGTT